MKSILQEEKKCYICGSTQWLENHHIFGGANRKLSEKYGLKVWLCHYCHNEPPQGVHFNAQAMNRLREDGQRAFERTHTHGEYMALFGKNYLEQEDED